MLAGNNINVSRTIQNTAAAGDILLIANNNITMTGGTVTSPNPVTLVVDNSNPAPPAIGLTNAFIMDVASTLTGTPLRIFTASQSLNIIQGQLNTNPFPNPPGTLFEDYSLEHWCTYFDCSFPYPFPGLGSPFTVFYKNCLPVITGGGLLVVSEMLFGLQEEFTVWPEDFYDLWRFLILYDRIAKASSFSSLKVLLDEYYWSLRRKLHFIHHPLVNRSL